MNGNKRRRLGRLTEDGLPRDGKDWTEGDWRALHAGLEKIKATIRSNHANDTQEDGLPRMPETDPGR